MSNNNIIKKIEKIEKKDSLLDVLETENTVSKKTEKTDKTVEKIAVEAVKSVKTSPKKAKKAKKARKLETKNAIKREAKKAKKAKIVLKPQIDKRVIENKGKYLGKQKSSRSVIVCKKLLRSIDGNFVNLTQILKALNSIGVKCELGDLKTSSKLGCFIRNAYYSDYAGLLHTGLKKEKDGTVSIFCHSDKSDIVPVGYPTSSGNVRITFDPETGYRKVSKRMKEKLTKDDISEMKEVFSQYI